MDTCTSRYLFPISFWSCYFELHVWKTNHKHGSKVLWKFLRKCHAEVPRGRKTKGGRNLQEESSGGCGPFLKTGKTKIKVIFLVSVSPLCHSLVITRVPWEKSTWSSDCSSFSPFLCLPLFITEEYSFLGRKRLASQSMGQKLSLSVHLYRVHVTVRIFRLHGQKQSNNSNMFCNSHCQLLLFLERILNNE